MERNEISYKGTEVPMSENVVGVDNNRFLERYLLTLEGSFYLMYDVKDIHIDEVCFSSGYISFKTLDDAKRGYEQLPSLYRS